MPQFITDFFNKLKEVFKKLTTTQKMILGGIVVIVIIAVVMLLSFTGQPSDALLYSKTLEDDDLKRVQEGLHEMGTSYHVDSKNRVYVPKDDITEIRAYLDENNYQPDQITGWELFDVPAWSRTSFHNEIDKQRAIVGHLTKHLERFSFLDDVSVIINFPEERLYKADQESPTATITVEPVPNVSLLDDIKKVRTILNSVKRVLGEMIKDENITIADIDGNDLTELLKTGQGDYIEWSKKQLKIRDSERAKIESKIKQFLNGTFKSNEYDVTVAMELNFDQKKEKLHEIRPILVREDNPNTPYDESEVQVGAQRSQLIENEGYTGEGFKPQGPPGAEPNLPPAYPEVEGIVSKYSNFKKIVNIDHSEADSEIRYDWFAYNKLTVSVVLDGLWERTYDDEGRLRWTNGNQIVRNYIERDKQTISKVEDLVKTAMGYDRARGDMVTVQNIPFNWEDKFRQESLEEWRKMQLRRTILILLAVLFVVFIGTLIYRAIQREIERRRRLREEEELRRQQALREAAIRQAEAKTEEVVDWEERARKEMEENAIKLARERPEEVASLIRTWMVEE